jgi:hypothetical protein
MLKVTVDLHPGGASEFRRTLGTMTISNVTELSDISDYEITATEAASPLTGQPARMRWFRLRGHHRRQSVWKLVASAIAGLDGAECAKL